MSAPKTRKIFPPNFISHPSGTFNLHIIAEGYTSEDQFYIDCIVLREKLLYISPFNVLKTYPHGFAMYTHYTQSSTTGPRITNLANDQSTASPLTLLDSVFNTVQQKLFISDTLLTNVVNSLGIPYYGTTLDVEAAVRPNTDPDLSGYGLILALLPEVTSLGASNGKVEMERRAGTTWYYAATSANLNFEYTVARALGRAIGLGDEFGTNPGYPSTTSDQRTVSKFPNVVYIPGGAGTGTYMPPADFKWNPFLTIGQRQTTGLQVYSAVSTNAGKFGLFQGAGGFQTNVYRSALECLMTQNVGDTSRQLKDKKRAFCPICTKIIQSSITGRRISQLDLVRNISSQRSMFDQVVWNTPTSSNSNISVPAGESISTAPTGSPNEFWTYTQFIDGSYGLKLQNVSVKNATTNLSSPVFRSLEFSPITVYFDNNTFANFNMASAFSSANAELWKSNGVKSYAPDKKFQRGIKLLMEQEMSGIKISVELSIVFRGGVNDFEPVGAICGMKIYPQVSMTWERVSGNLSVTKFETGVVMVVNAHDEDDPGENNYTNFFHDSNTTGKDGRYVNGGGAVLLPLDWCRLFDSYLSNVQSRTVTAVYGPLNPTKWATSREANYTLYPFHELKIIKFPRQGAYDNIHLHGYSGYHDEDPDPPNNPNYPAYPHILRVEAPGCPDACFHMHWRWGTMTETPGFMKPFMDSPPFKKFFGWTHDLNFAKSNTILGAPLIPPNQELVVAAGTQNGNKEKIIESRFSVYRPKARHKQVILEYGCAIAIGPPFKNLDFIAWVYSMPNNVINSHESFKMLYDRIRFLYRLGTYYEQVPVGTFAPNNNPIETL